MPKIIAKVEGKGNGIKTVIVNVVEVAKALNRPAMYPTKYFGCILGAQVQFETKNDRYIVNGAHDADKLQDLLDGFIQKYVLCPSCENPETVLAVKKQIITTSCKACGYSGTLSATDKLASYIIKYPPHSDKEQTKLVNAAALGSGKKAKAKDKKSSKRSPEHNGDEDDENNENGNGNSNGSPVHESDGEDNVDWGEDTSEDAVAKRMADLSMGIKGLTVNNDLEKKESERLTILFEFIKQRLDKINDFVAQKEIVAEAERLEVRDKAVIGLCEHLFNEKIVQQIKMHRILFLRFTADNRKAQRYLLRGVELTIQQYEKELLSKVLLVFKTLYDEDLIEEKVFIQWASKVCIVIV